MDNEKLDLILERLEVLEEKVQDNNKILHSERNAKRWGMFFGLIKWLIITVLGILIWAYIQPYYKSLMETYDNLVKTNAEMQKTFKSVNEQKGKLDKLMVDPSVLWKNK